MTEVTMTHGEFIELIKTGCGTALVEQALKKNPEWLDMPDEVYGDTPMFWAAGGGHVEIIETLIRFGSQVIDKPNVHGFTPLFWANSKVAVADTFKALNINIPGDSNLPPSPGFVEQVRYRVYFAESLAQRLLYHTSRRPK